ncbi:MAG: phosphate-starvation-inducible PsiE family protein [candidate division KSB1 bacterium]|nr:phosphate-starvation-inducible PsiE family protein [candidate division KSB1 bacterium]MDZ7318584.1 phosphate-starvation-inducible PsiE family protein [candidate division KSB1 bacterium]MDZ7339720.1 phosphate-starvation-inducible PsiE family protein [candidate division KSB1 bacterium]
MHGLLEKFDKFIFVALIILMMIVLLLSLVELCWIIIKDIISEPMFILEIDELLDIFGLFMLVLIGIELLDTIKTYLKQRVMHVEVVMIVAMIAISRKVIILDLNKYSSLTLMGIAALIISLSVGYYFIKRIHRAEENFSASMDATPEQ